MEPLIVLSLWDMPRPCICFIVSVHHSPSFFQSVCSTVSYIFTSSSKAIALVCNMDPKIPLQRQLFDLRDAEHIYHLMIIQVSDKTFNKNSLNREFIWILLVSSAEWIWTICFFPLSLFLFLSACYMISYLLRLLWFWLYCLSRVHTKYIVYICEPNQYPEFVYCSLLRIWFNHTKWMNVT